MGSCAAPSAKGDDKFITTDYLQQCHDRDTCPLVGKQQRNQHQPVTVRRTRSPWREKNQKWGADRLNAHRRNTLY
ncbi:hypothetical protein CEG94_16405 [Shigella boydii]|nr:hypothetical protein CEG94_16405 [Shigella boydii]